MIKWANKYTGILLFLLIVLAFFVADGWHIINFPPTSIHQWRQADCVAYALNYYKKNSAFLQPSFYNLVVSGGRSVSEIPVFYYAAAKLYHLFGIHFWVLRGLTFLSYLAGIFYLLGCTRFFIKHPLIAVLPVIILATTPYYYFYALNVLPNVPAISFSFGGLYYMLRYENTDAKKYLVISTLFFILSVLLKPTDGGLIWLAYLCVVAKDFVFKKRRDQKVIPIIISALLIGACLYIWYKYANWYNAVNNNELNLLGIYPIWDMPKADILYTIGWRMRDDWGPGYQHPIIMCFMVLLGIIYIIKWKQLDSFLKFFTLFLILGSISYSVLWFKAFADLDYYQLINVIAPTFLFITVLKWYIDKVSFRLSKTVFYLVSGVLILSVVVSIAHNAGFQYKRYNDVASTYKKRYFYEIGPYLRSIGISENDTVISIKDISPNITLTALRNPGYSSFFYWDLVTIQKHKLNGAKYLIVSDTEYFHLKAYAPYMTKQIGQFHDIYIYDLR